MHEWIHSILLYNEDMVLTFTRLSFWVFFAAVLLGYSFVYRRQDTLKAAYLLAASLFFYYKTSGFYFLLLVFVTISDYGIAMLIAGSRRKAVRRMWLAASVSIDLCLLAYFKYASWLSQTFYDLFDLSFDTVNVFASAFNSVTGSESLDVSQLLLPVGISFYLFQTISYTIDVYRRKIAPVRNIVHFGFYVSFFPQLVAGPIVRASDFIPQIKAPYSLTQRQLWAAMLLIAGGLVKKIVVSDYIAFHYVDRIFDNSSLYSGFELLMGAYGYAIQIYCDFSGYTDIAIGVAQLLGFRLPLNFDSPYLANSISNFWRRWHISLSSWLRDYLYISLGGSRRGKVRTCLNLMLTMLLGGLWHGANYTFIIWGGLHGVLLVMERLWRNAAFRLKRITMPRPIAVFLTFHLVCLLWIFFRSEDVESAFSFIYGIYDRFYFNIVPDIAEAYRFVFAVIGAAYCLHFLPRSLKERCKERFIALPAPVKIAFFALLVFFMFQMVSAESAPFIYFQF